MNFMFILSALFVMMVFPFAGACMAKNFGRSFWIWFWLSVPLPFITLIILISLPDKSKEIVPVLAYEADEFGIYN